MKNIQFIAIYSQNFLEISLLYIYFILFYVII